MANLFDINLVCLDGGEHFVGDGETHADTAGAADFIRTPVSGNDHLDAVGGGVVDFDLDDDGANSAEEDMDIRGGISDNDSDDTAPAVEESPKRDCAKYALKQVRDVDPRSLPPQTIVLQRSAQFSSEPSMKTRIELLPHPLTQVKKPWHLEMLDSLMGSSAHHARAHSTVTHNKGGAMTYEEALRRRPTRRQPKGIPVRRIGSV